MALPRPSIDVGMSPPGKSGHPITSLSVLAQFFQQKALLMSGSSVLIESQALQKLMNFKTFLKNRETLFCPLPWP